MNKLATFFGFVGIALLVFAFLSGIGYFLYLWGAMGIAVGLAAWKGFITWLTMISSGILLVALGAVYAKVR